MGDIRLGANEDGGMNPPMVENILGQGNSLRGVAAHQYGEGRDALAEAGRILRASRQIVLSGMGVSYNVCLPLSNYFAGRGIVAPVIETAELLYFQNEVLREGTTLILVSRSGESVEATKALALARERGCPVIGVVNVEGSTIAREATHTLEMHSAADQLPSIQTYSGSIAVLLLLGAAFAEELDGPIRGDLETTAGLLSKWAADWMHFSGGWPGFFANNPPIYVLGRGNALPSALTGALLLQEVVKIPAIAMSSAQFRHGPVEVVDEQQHVIVFGTAAKTRELDEALAERLVDMGAHLRWIGPAPVSSKVQQLCEWPAHVPELFIPLLDAVPMQIAAYETARWHGLTIGDLKFATPVTLSEQEFAQGAAG
jgi:glucosamine--fructose-6-phosphate aminotransferase (isomerizing)